MKAIKVVFVVALLWVSFGLMLTGFRSYDYLTRIYIPSVSVMYLLKFLSFVTSLCIGGLLYALFQRYHKSRFFDSKDAQFVRFIGYLSLITAVFNSSANSLRDRSPKEQLPTMGEFMKGFMSDFMFESPLFLLFALLTFLLAAFMQKALNLKSENESFI
ncbi:MAG: DUF2975 domain-containing protein [Cytophagia bacterium]|nr:MAG: DUF2975 domain-containing protein [Cytophagia bacterium]TAG61469.1 MAG: DUF2975 domain-containing protein [Runella slithyformis]